MKTMPLFDTTAFTCRAMPVRLPPGVVPLPTRPDNIIPFLPKEAIGADRSVQETAEKKPREAADKQRKYEVASVEYIYNGDCDKFSLFLSSVIQEYVDADRAAPDDTDIDDGGAALYEGSAVR